VKAPGHDTAAPVLVAGYPWPEGSGVDTSARSEEDDRVRGGYSDRDLSDPELDVRRVVARLPRRDAAPSLDDVEWGRFWHARGRATDVPDLLRRLADPDPEAAAVARRGLGHNLFPDSITSSVGPLTVPFLIRAAADPSVHRRGWLLDLAAEIGRRDHYGGDSRSGLLRAVDNRRLYDPRGYPTDWSVQAGRDALALDRAILLSLLDDPDPDVRCHAAYALAAASEHAAEIIDGLRARLPAETEPAVRISLVLAVAQVAADQDHDTVAALEWAHALWSDPADMIDVRLGAAIGWLCLTDAPPPADLLDLLGQAATPSMADVMRQVPLPYGIDERGGLGAWLVRLLGDQPGPRAGLARRLATCAHAPTRIAVIRAGYEAAEHWRSATGEIVDALADRLADPDPGVARVAARHLCRVGAATKPVADRLATALDHPDGEVCAWMAVALAHCGDRRAVDPLVDLFGQDRCPWPAHTRWGDDIRPPVRLLDGLRPYAAELLSALTKRLYEGGEGWSDLAHDLVCGLGGWGPDAGPAAGAVAAFLFRGPLDTDTVVTALARIGPAAAFAAPVLDIDILAARGDDRADALLAWARWRITGERTDATVATLARHGRLRLLADLGPAAVAAADTIRPLLTDRPQSVRVEAAHAVWATTGQPQQALPALLREVHHVDEPHQLTPAQIRALRYVADIGRHLGGIDTPAAAPVVGVLEAFLGADRRIGGGTGDPRDGYDAISWDQHCQRVAIDALTQIDPARKGLDIPARDVDLGTRGAAA
jgi:hypothetical protein